MEHKFKIGDWVIANRVNHTKNNSAFPLNISWRILDIFKGIDGKWNVSVDKKINRINGSCTYLEDIRYALQHEIPIEFRIKTNYYFY
jgi:hypothetical protein